MCMFELRVVQHTKHALHSHVCRNPGTYAVSALLLQRWRKSDHDSELHREFHWVGNGKNDLEMMWQQGAPMLQPPMPENRLPAVALEISDSETEVEEEEYFDDDEVAAEMESERKNFIVAANRLAVSRSKDETTFKLYPHRMPRCFKPGDHRFRNKTERTYACDTCGQLVTYSSQTRGTGSRSQCDFLGAYRDNSWRQFPGECQQRAWELALIDCTWFCHAECGGGITGSRSFADRQLRTMKYREAQAKKARRW